MFTAWLHRFLVFTAGKRLIAAELEDAFDDEAQLPRSPALRLRLGDAHARQPRLELTQALLDLSHEQASRFRRVRAERRDIGQAVMIHGVLELTQRGRSGFGNTSGIEQPVDVTHQ